MNEIGELMAGVLARAALAPEEAAEERAAREAAELAAEVERQVGYCTARGVPLRAARHVAGVCRDTPAMTATRSWWQSDKCLLVLAGPKGVGKSVAAAWVVAQQPKSGPPTSRHVDAGMPDFSNSRNGRPRPGWRVGPRFVDAAGLARVNRYDAAQVDELVCAATLAIDDLGVEFVDAKGAFASLLDEVINARYGNELRTVITTNLPAKDFKARFGERIADRIREAGIWHEHGGESMRAQIKAVR